MPTLNPINQTQQNVVIRQIGRVRRGPNQRGLSHLPRTKPARTVSHAGDHEETVKILQTMPRRWVMIPVSCGMGRPVPVGGAIPPPAWGRNCG